MRRWLPSLWTIGCVLVFGVPLRADEQADKIIKQSIAARGSVARLNKIKGYEESSRGTISVMGMDIDFTAESLAAPPTRMKTTLKMEVNGMAHTIKVLFNGVAMTRSIDGNPLPLKEEEKDDARQRMHVAYLMRLTPLLDHQKYQLKCLVEAKVNGKDAQVIEISGKELRDTKFYFDKSTHLLAKVEYEGIGPGGNKGKQELVLSEYKEFNGIRQPTRLVISHDGTKFLEQTLTKYKILEKVNDSDFID
jgi:hypothetical protein